MKVFIPFVLLCSIFDFIHIFLIVYSSLYFFVSYFTVYSFIYILAEKLRSFLCVCLFEDMHIVMCGFIAASSCIDAFTGESTIDARALLSPRSAATKASEQLKAANTKRLLFFLSFLSPLIFRCVSEPREGEKEDERQRE